jgi:hypothetical protein
VYTRYIVQIGVILAVVIAGGLGLIPILLYFTH